MANASSELILASRSPRRRELLTAAGYPFEVCPPSEAAECGVCSGETPAELVARLAYQKAADVARRIDRGVDPRLRHGGRMPWPILGKPADEEHARAMLADAQRAGASRSQRAVSVAVPDGQPDGSRGRDDAAHGPTHARNRLDAYLASGQWEGKAGAFGYQDGLDWVHVVEGSESNVVGLPMELLAEMLRRIDRSE